MKKTALSGDIINRTWSRLKPFLRLLVYRNWWTIRKNRIALGEQVRIVGSLLVVNDKTQPGSVSIGDGTTLNSHYLKEKPSATTLRAFSV